LGEQGTKKEGEGGPNRSKESATIKGGKKTDIQKPNLNERKKTLSTEKKKKPSVLRTSSNWGSPPKSARTRRKIVGQNDQAKRETEKRYKENP